MQWIFPVSEPSTTNLPLNHHDNQKKWNSLQRDEVNRSLCPSLLSLSYSNCILTKQGEQNHYRTLKGRDTCASHPWCYSSTLTQKHIQMINTVCAKNAIQFHYVTKTHWVTVSLQRWGKGTGGMFSYWLLPKRLRM